MHAPTPLKIARILRFILFIFVAMAAARGSAQDNLHVRGELVAAADTVPSGGQVMLALSMTPDRGWHGYWINGGDAGFGMELEWTLPDGVTVGTPQYPVPETYVLQGLMNHVYEQPYAILIPITVDRSVAAGTDLDLTADGNWLACSDKICVPQQGRFRAKLTVSDAPAQDPRFATWASKLPSPLNAAASYRITDGRLTLSIPFPADAALEDAHFFAETDGLIDYGAPQDFTRDGDVLIITTKAADNSKSEIGETQGLPLNGVLKIGPDLGLSLTATADANLAGAGGGGALQAVGGAGGMLLTLGAALLGGLLLNIMPCVFPILGLKALTLAKGGQDERAARRDALAYTGGVIATTVALGGILLLLRAGGEQVGWAFQLQNPAIVFFLLLLMVAITLNLLGLFEVPGMAGIGPKSNGVSGKGESSFMTGALAAFVATPCTGPFMAAALGAALVLPTAAALALFAALGLGIALPFLALGYVPALRRALPKPGPWLATFRRWMALPMALTALALLWLWGQMGGAMWLAALGIAALAAVLYVAGKGQSAGRTAAPMLAATAALFVAAPAAVAAFPTLTAAQSDAKADDTAIPFTPAKLAQLRAADTPVFLYFTADWCITCKANEAAVLSRDEMANAFAANNVTIMRADFTRRDAAIAAFLAEKGRAGVPLYLFYPKGGEAAELPQILTIDIVKSAIMRS